MLLTISLSDLYCILRSERITALRAEFRWILRICRFPLRTCCSDTASSSPASSLRSSYRTFLYSTVPQEQVQLSSTGRDAPHSGHEFPRRNRTTATGPGTSRSPYSVPCRRKPAALPAAVHSAAAPAASGPSQTTAAHSDHLH